MNLMFFAVISKINNKMVLNAKKQLTNRKKYCILSLYFKR